ncbi:hypothetical protein WDU94_007634 [Cyamophila willieti]
MKKNILTFKGCNYLRQRLILSTLSCKPIQITDIRAGDLDGEPGLKEYEVNLLRLIDKLTNGTTLEVNETGTTLVFQPGILVGGSIQHECCKERAIGYYFEVCLAFAPFCKKGLQIVLRGVTNNQKDPSVDSFKAGALPVLKQFLVVDPGIELTVRKRGMEPEGGGEIFFNCPNIKSIKPVQNKDFGKIKRIRGTVFALRVSPAIANRIVDTAKGILLSYIPDVYLSVDHCKGPKSGKSPGFGGSIYSESTTGVVLTADAVSPPPPVTRAVPEQLGEELAYSLLEEISRGGMADSSFQSLACLYMALHQKDVSQLLVGPLSPYTVQFLRHLKQFFGLKFKLEYESQCSPDPEEDEQRLRVGQEKVLLTCVGIGYNKLV